MLKKEYDDIVKYLSKKQTLNPDDRKLLEAFIAKVKASSVANDALGAAMVVQSATYLEDWADVDAAYERILTIQPSNDTALAQWMASQNKRSRYEASIALANRFAPDMAAMPKSGLVVAESLIDLNRFTEASELLTQLSAAIAPRADLTGPSKLLQTRSADLAAKFAQETGLRAAEAQKNDLPQIELITSKGVVFIELFEDQAPATTAAIVTLVEQGAYNGTRFHKRVPGLGILGGDPNTKAGSTGRPGWGSPGWRVVDEGARSDRRVAFGGTIGLAKAMDPAKPGTTVANSGGQTLFFLQAPAEHLNDQFTVAGRIVDGMDVLAELTTSDEITSATVVRKRPGNEYKNVPMPELTQPLEVTIPPAPGPKPQTPNISRAASPAPIARPPQQPRPSSPPVMPAGTPLDPNNNPLGPRPNAPPANPSQPTR